MEQALTLFKRDGYGAMSFSDLAKETGVLRGSLYNAYGGKEDLFVRVYSVYGDCFVADARSALAVPGSLETKLRGFFDVCIRSMRGVDGPAYGCLSTRAIMEAARTAPALGMALTKMLRGLEDALTETLEASPDFQGEALATAELLVTLTRGVAVMDRIYNDEKRLHRLADQAVQLVCK